MRKILGTAILCGALYTSGCTSKFAFDYAFEGVIEKESVKFYTTRSGIYVMQIKKENGDMVNYQDIDNDYKIDRVSITMDGKQYFYENDKKEKDLILIAQNDFDSYLKDIEAIKNQKAEKEKESYNKKSVEEENKEKEKERKRDEILERMKRKPLPEKQDSERGQ